MEKEERQTVNSQSAALLEWNAFNVALGFLSILPAFYRGELNRDAVTASLKWYPLIGFALGAILYGVGMLLPFPSLVSAALLLIFSIALTGALHIDGLADCADAWVGGHGNKERTLTIMKDPSSGPMAVTAVVGLLLLKFTIYVELIVLEAFAVLIIAMFLSRMAILCLVISTRYVGEGVMGEALSRASNTLLWGSLFIWTGLFVIALPVSESVTTLSALILVTALARYLMVRRIGGFTGDCAGALIEVSEVAILLVGLVI